MRIRIKEKSNDKNINISIPMWLVTVCIKHVGFITRVSSKGIDPKTMEIINSIDFRLIARNFNQLKKYKGLRIIDVKEKDGDEVTIEI
ncbi:hypothetical protein [Clostridium cadaveris]|uniref:hypothetical protein n=1 Tax=Clostridium cadaveris TaxID=1529 RepID=UPI0015B49132|nr:hypothetical protein [Clostridium cadaveris]NWK09819.1 hypothetical protein [Clostridium cadaveris]